ncbi:MAG: sensor histidine kinase [Bacillaceae bacterium]|nr:sensor histidine kinase [Bacillaceae bacterium]
MTEETHQSRIESVLKKVISTVERSKQQIFEITESSRREAMAIQKEWQQVKMQVAEIIQRVDELEKKLRLSRRRLAEVSRNLRHFNEQDIRDAYEQASQYQTELTLSREREVHLRNKRDELERRLRDVMDTIKKGEAIMSQVGVVLDFLTGDVMEMEEELETAQSRQLLGLKIIQAQEEERKRVARDIHDGPAQSMANVVMRSEVLERLLTRQKIQDAHEELKELKEIVRDSLSEIRKIIFDLRPMALDDLGLIPTLRKFVDEFQKRYQLNTGLVVSGQEYPMPSSLKTALFRLIQESLVNAAKHASADYVEVKLEFSIGSIKVYVKDNGIGYKPGKKKGEHHYGIMGMQERTELLEGIMEIDSEEGKGTEVYFYIPFSPEED